MNNEHHENGALRKSVDFHCSCVPLRCGHMLRLVYGANRASVSAQALAHRLLGRGPQDQRIGSEDWYSFTFETTPVGRVISIPVINSHGSTH